MAIYKACYVRFTFFCFILFLSKLDEMVTCLEKIKTNSRGVDNCTHYDIALYVRSREGKYMLYIYIYIYIYV